MALRPSNTERRAVRILRAFTCAVIAGISAALLAGCVAPAVHVRPDPANPIYRVAVLPIYNASNDVEGARMMREEFFKRMAGRHYDVVPLKETDRLLMEKMGITLGSQLELTNARQLGEELGVDGVVFGYLLNFEDITTGFYNVKKVRAGFKLVDTKTGQAVWSRGAGVKRALAGGNVGAGITIFKELMDAREGIEGFSAIAGIGEIQGLDSWQILFAGEVKKAGDAAALAIGEKLITKALGVHMMYETDIMLNRIMHAFPAGPGRQVR